MTLKCETAQTPSTVTWLKGHTELKAGSRYVMSQKEGVITLTIKDLEEKDTDIYTCDVGTAKSMAKVTVKGKSRTKRKTLIVDLEFGFLCLQCSVDWVFYYRKLEFLENKLWILHVSDWLGLFKRPIPIIF